MEPREYIEKDGYIEAIGRRKTATARVRIMNFNKTKDTFIINNLPIEKYFKIDNLVRVAKSPFEKVDTPFNVSVRVVGSGSSAQAEAIRHGLSRAIVLYDKENRKVLKQVGFLKRDPRKVERKKFGLKKARKRPQWSKR